MPTNAYYTNQYISTTLASVGGIDDSATTGIILASVTNITTDKPGIACLSYTDPIDTSKAEWITYTSIDSGTKELQGVTRGQEDFSAKAHSNGVTVAFPLSKSHINNLNDALIIGGDETDLVTGVIDDDTMATASATTLATSESTKAYIDNGTWFNGWIPVFETWEYVSVDDPTGVFRINADVTTKYSVGMRLKMTNGGNTIYGIITAVSAYGAIDAGYTHITFLHQIDPADSLALYLMANSAITANYYSTQKAPFGFPLDPRKWTVVFKDTANRTQSTPTQNVWYNLGSYGLTIPVGAWRVSYSAILRVFATSTTQVSPFITLSTANNSESDAEFTFMSLMLVGSANIATFTPMFKQKNIILSSKTIYYLNVKTDQTTASDIGIYSASSNTIIRAECAYL